MLEILNASYTVVMLLLSNKGKDVNFKEFHVLSGKNITDVFDIMMYNFKEAQGLFVFLC